MSVLAWMVVGLGVLVIASRGPMIFAPAATLAFYSKLFESPGKIRAMGVVVVGMGAAFVASAEGVGGTAAGLARMLGWLWVSCGLLFLIILPNVYRAVAEAALDLIADVARPLGVVAVLIGLGIVWLGATAVP